MSNRLKKLPYIQFFTGDWIRDTRMLSLESRAIWLDLLCLMHDGDQRGYLSRNSVNLSVNQLARFCGCSEEIIAKSLAEILASDVASKTENGTIFSRRMVRDQEKRLINSKNGKRGGNPNLKNSVKPPVKPPDVKSVKRSSGIGNRDGNSEFDGEGCGERKVESVAPQSPESLLATEWLFYHKGPKTKATALPAVTEVMAELLKRTPIDQIKAWIKSPERSKIQPIWEFEKRWTANVNGRHAPTTDGIDEGIRRLKLIQNGVEGGL